MRTAIGWLAVAVATALAPVCGATLITGNPGSWNGSDGEFFPNDTFAVFETVTIPDPGPGAAWRVDSVTLTAWQGSSGGTGWQAWLNPGTLTNNQVYVDQPNNNTDLGDAIYLGPVGVGVGNATTATALFTTPFLVGPGNYYLEIKPLTPGFSMAIARDGGVNSYAGGAEGYFQPPPPATVGMNANHDLVFALNGEVVLIPEPSIMGLLGCSGLLLLGRHRRWLR